MCVVAENIRKIIAERGLKQKVVAEKAGYTERSFSDLLCGRKRIDTEDVIRIIKVLHVLPNDLYGIVPESESEEKGNDPERRNGKGSGAGNGTDTTVQAE